MTLVTFAATARSTDRNERVRRLTATAATIKGDMHTDYTIRLTDVADESTRHAVLDPLVAYNRAMTGRDDHRPLVLTIETPAGEVIGGLWGQTAYDWLFVALLFVPEPLRRRGVGTELLRRAEREAVSRGCHNAWLDTFEFQARGFYERLGYRCFAELADYPPGSARYFLKKALT